MNWKDQIRPLPGYVLTMLILSVLDARLGVEISLWVLFLLPIGWASWNLGQGAGFVLVVLAAGMLLGLDALYGGRFAAFRYLALSVGFKTIAYSVVAWLIGLLRASEVERVHLPADWPKSQ